jgi:2',5'-phosphodiesterase
MLLANTHLFFHPSADFIRLLQAMIATKHLEKLKHTLETTDKSISKLSIIFGGDFNSDPPSKAFKYIFTQNIPLDDVLEGFPSISDLILQFHDYKILLSIQRTKST